MNVSWYPEVLKKYATFTGRAGREEFWVYALFNFLIFFSFYVVALVSRVPIMRSPIRTCEASGSPTRHAGARWATTARSSRPL